MEKILEYPLRIQARQLLQLHKSAQFLALKLQNNTICTWFTANLDEPTVEVEVLLVGTGGEAPDENTYIHMGTVPVGGFVWHLFLNSYGTGPARKELPLEPSKGLYEKFEVTRRDGTSAPGGKHENCEYFVLDLDHDPHAKVGLTAYANSVEFEKPQLAADLRQRHNL